MSAGIDFDKLKVKVNPDKKENLKIVGILYVIGVLAGIVINWL